RNSVAALVVLADHRGRARIANRGVLCRRASVVLGGYTVLHQRGGGTAPGSLVADVSGWVSDPDCRGDVDRAGPSRGRPARPERPDVDGNGRLCRTVRREIDVDTGGHRRRRNHRDLAAAAEFRTSRALRGTLDVLFDGG